MVIDIDTSLSVYATATQCVVADATSLILLLLKSIMPLSSENTAAM